MGVDAAASRVTLANASAAAEALCESTDGAAHLFDLGVGQGGEGRVLEAAGRSLAVGDALFVEPTDERPDLFLGRVELEGKRPRDSLSAFTERRDEGGPQFRDD